MTDVIAGCASNIFAINDVERFIARLVVSHPDVVITRHSRSELGDHRVSLHAVYGNWPALDGDDNFDDENFYQVLLDHAGDDLIILNTVSIMGPGNIQFESILLSGREELPGVWVPVLKSINLDDIERLQSFVSQL